MGDRRDAEEVIVIRIRPDQPVARVAQLEGDLVARLD
jgi:hypothetical protein